MNDLNRSPRHSDETRRFVWRVLRWMPAVLVIASFASVPLFAQAGPSDDTLRVGADVYRSACAACHQPGGAGLPGQFPPLRDNPNIDDTEYVVSVIQNGLDGSIIVDGDTYDGTMPAQSTLSDTDTDAVVAYIQSGFASPAVPVQDEFADEDAGGGLSGGVVIAVLLVVFAVVVIIFARRVFGVCDRRTLPWSIAWLKTGVIVIGMIVATTIVPSRVLESDAVRDMSRSAQDLITLGCWSVGLFGGLWILWWAHRGRRI
jgi:mono/diheme cytochrome c family protein